MDTSKFESSLNQWLNSFDNSIDKAMRQAIPLIREGAIAKCKINEGDLKDSIKIEYEKKNGLYTGKIFVTVDDVPYLMFVYYGTGKYANGQRYGNGGGANGSWYVPASKVSKDVSMYNGWELHGEGTANPFYIVSGQKPRPFLHQGLSNTKQQALDKLVTVIKSAMKG